MAKLLLNLRHVPDDEADEVRALLREADIKYYETPANRWGITAGGIWISDEAQAPRARELFKTYQRRRARRARADWLRRRRAGQTPGLIASLLGNPLQTTALLAIIGLIAWISTVPFMRMGS